MRFASSCSLRTFSKFSLRRLIAVVSFLCSIGEDTKMDDGTPDDESSNGVAANGENHDGENGDQFARVVFCLDNAVEIAQSL